MKKLSMETIVLDQRKVYSHLLILLVSLLIGVYSYFMNESKFNLEDQLGTTVLIFAYMETFIFLAGKMFTKKVLDTTRKHFLKDILLRFLLFYVLSFISALIIIILFKYCSYLWYGQDIYDIIPNFFKFDFNDWFNSTIKGLTFGAVIFIFSTLSTALKKGRQLKEENLIFQNETLKNQINPHFLFNNLNTISSLISTKPELAEKFINKFSDIYRYILENIKKDKVPLKMEFDFISDYFEIHKIRDEGKILLHIDQTNVENYSIPPVSLQILIENAIKHNMATREKPLHISVVIENDHVIVRNNLQKMANQFGSTRIGIKNLKERIQLISDQPLVIEENRDMFMVKIPLLP